MTNERRKPVRIVATPDEPYAFDCFDRYPEHCWRPGFEIEYMYSVINGMLHLPVEFVKVDSYEAVEEALEIGQADITGTSLMLDESYYSRWMHTPVYVWDGVAFIAKLNVEGNFSIFGMFKAFPFELWLSLALLSLMVLAVAWCSEKTTHFKRRNCITIANNKFRQDCLSVIWFISVNVLLNFYANLIIVELMLPVNVEAPSFDSVPSLGKKLLSKECRLAILDIYANDTEFHSTFINPDEKFARDWADLYRKAYRINPPIYTSSREETAAFVQNSTCVIGVDFATMDSYYNTRFCNIRFVSFPEELKLFEYVFYFTDSTLARNISAVMTTEPFQAFPLRLAKKYYLGPNRPICKKGYQLGDVSDSLPLEKFYGTFLVFGSLLVVSALMYITILYSAKLKHYLVEKCWFKNSLSWIGFNNKRRHTSVITLIGINLNDRKSV